MIEPRRAGPRFRVTATLHAKGRDPETIVPFVDTVLIDTVRVPENTDMIVELGWRAAFRPPRRLKDARLGNAQMRSIYVFADATADDMATWLDATAARNPSAEQWFYPSADERAAYVELADWFYDELEPEVDDTICAQFAGRRPLCVCVDVSRRPAGGKSASELIVALLTRFPGRAMNDESEELWTLPEVLAGEKAGTPFVCLR